MLEVRHTIEGTPASAAQVREWKDRQGWDKVQGIETKIGKAKWIVNWQLKS